VSVGHPEAFRICRALIERANVIPDFRVPDGVRLGLAAATTRFTDVWDGMEALRRIVANGEYLTVDPSRGPVT
jgi:kynureninase